jgi:hypothetical protein
MAQPTLRVNRITISGLNERMFIPFFNIDSDFGENEDYFREDTLELGFRNESERCSKEMFEKFKAKFPTPKGEDDHGGLWIVEDEQFMEAMEEILEECANVSIGGSRFKTQFILGNNTYTRQYEINCIFNQEYNGIDYDGDVEVIISYMG